MIGDHQHQDRTEKNWNKRDKKFERIKRNEFFKEEEEEEEQQEEEERWMNQDVNHSFQEEQQEGEEEMKSDEDFLDSSDYVERGTERGSVEDQILSGYYQKIKAGDLESIRSLASLFERGDEGVKRNYKKSFKLYNLYQQKTGDQQILKKIGKKIKKKKKI